MIVGRSPLLLADMKSLFKSIYHVTPTVTRQEDNVARCTTFYSWYDAECEMDRRRNAAAAPRPQLDSGRRAWCLSATKTSEDRARRRTSPRPSLRRCRLVPPARPVDSHTSDGRCQAGTTFVDASSDSRLPTQSTA